MGFCGIRGNLGGKLQLFVYGKIIAGHVDPIEKKPVTHYMPGSRIFSIATTGCSWACAYCQNYDISQRRKVEGLDATPESVVEMTKRYRCEGLAYTYNEPSIFIEFAHDIGVQARKAGLINIFVSNGYDTPDGVGLMRDFLDCITVDFKGSGETKFVRRYITIANADPIFQTLLELRDKTKVHIEITDLIVPEVGDDLDAAKKLCSWVNDNLGPDTPIHFLRFHPDYKMLNLPPTPTKTLEKHHAVAKEVGLNYAYLGNVPGHPLEHTYCSECGKVVVERFGFDISSWHLDEQNRCEYCGNEIPIVGHLSKSINEERFVPIIM
jgi:pyruvate formate lyase activating enzyme